MEISSRIHQQFQDNADVVMRSAELLAEPIATAAELIVQALLNNGKILVCGHGALASSSEHLVSSLVGHFERERPELAAIALTTNSALLTASADEHGAEDVFARQIRALGQHADVLVCLSTQDNAPAISAAIEAAHQREMPVVALTGSHAALIAEQMHAHDVHICVPHTRGARILEVHTLVIHCICDGIDYLLMGEEIT